jgi:hypothetical protein
MHLLLCQYHVVLVTKALKHILKPGNVILPALFFLPLISLVNGAFYRTKEMLEWVFSVYMKMALIVTSIELCNCFSNKDILMILIFEIHKHGKSFHLFVSSSILVINVLLFSL